MIGYRFRDLVDNSTMRHNLSNVVDESPLRSLAFFILIKFLKHIHASYEEKVVIESLMTFDKLACTNASF